MSEAYPRQFPDSEAGQAQLLQEFILLQIDEVLEPDDPNLELRRMSFWQEMADAGTPPVLESGHAANSMDRMRKYYQQTKVAMLMEHLPVTDGTPSYDYWAFVAAVEEKYKPKNR